MKLEKQMGAKREKRIRIAAANAQMGGETRWIRCPKCGMPVPIAQGGLPARCPNPKCGFLVERILAESETLREGALPPPVAPGPSLIRPLPSEFERRRGE